MSRRTKILLLGLMVLTAMACVALILSGGESEQAPVYILGTITRGAFKAEVSATGTLSPVITAQVGRQVAGAA